MEAASFVELPELEEPVLEEAAELARGTMVVIHVVDDHIDSMTAMVPLAQLS